MGNNGAGAGALDVAVTAMCIKNNTVPPSLNVSKVDPECGLNVVMDKPMDAKVKVAVTVAYALGGGQNAVLVLKRID